MPLEVQSALIGAFVTVAVMTGLLLRRRRRRTDVIFSILCVALVVWFLATFLRGVYGTDPWHRVQLALAALVPAAMIRLFSELMPWGNIRGRRLMNAAYPASVIVAVAALSPLGNLPVVQVATGVYIGVIILIASRVMMTAGDVAKGTIEYARRRYLAIGASLVTLLAILGDLEQLRGVTTSIGHLAVMLYVFFLAQVILRDRLLDLNEFVGRMMILGVLAILFAAISALLISLGTNASARLFNAVVGVIILLTLYEPLKERLEGKAIELFARERFRFSQTLEDLRRRMQHGVLDPAKMSSIVVNSLYDSRRATHVAIYLLEPMGNGFSLHAHRGPEPEPRVNANEHPALWQSIQQNRAPMLTEQFSRNSEDDGDAEPNRDLIDSLRAVSADVLLPFTSGEAVLGFLAMRDDRSAEPYSTAEIANLMKIAETAATVIWNSRLAERLRERERLAAIGAMAAGLAHEIRNPLGAIKGAAEYLDPKSLDHDEEGEFLQVIIDETNRLNSVVSQFLDYARPFRAKLRTTDVNAVLKKTAKLLEAQNTEWGGRIVFELDDALPTISADSEQLKQVILNLALNGLDASKSTGAPIRLSTRNVPDRACIELRVRDHGVGIPKDDLDQIFIPFFTTKQQGTGLGLAVCQRIIMNHGGTITFESQVGEGTECIIQLPIEQKDAITSTGSFTRPLKRSSTIPPTNTPIGPLPTTPSKEPV